MFGNILVDKFGCYAPVNTESWEEISGLMKHIRKVLSLHFNDNAFHVMCRRKRLHFGFNPTRYYNDAEALSLYTDVNMDMPTEEELFSLFEEIAKNELFMKNIPLWKITHFDLTKNSLMTYIVEEYIKMLAKYVFTGRYRKHFISSGIEKGTLSVTTLANNSDESDKVGDREEIFYDKVKELGTHGIRFIMLKKPLTEEEKKLVPEENYDGSRLFLKDLNILRVELQLGSSEKLDPVSKFLGAEHTEKGLFLSDFLYLLEQKKLYQKLNEYFSQFFINITGCNDIIENPNNTIYKKIIKDYWDDCLSLPIFDVFEDNDLGANCRKVLREIQGQINNPLFNELKEKILS